MENAEVIFGSSFPNDQEYTKVWVCQSTLKYGFVRVHLSMGLLEYTKVWVCKYTKVWVCKSTLRYGFVRVH